jgi:hypothetical protein
LASSDDHGIVSVRIRPGHAAAVIDASSHGALLETTHRMLPGHHVELQVETEQTRANVRARVVRCAVAHVRANGLSYRGAVAFERHLPWFVPDGHAHSHADHRPALPDRAPATPVVA